MKKLALIAAVLMSGAMAYAETFKHPAADQAVPASIYYGGVKYSTSDFSAILTTVTFSTVTAVGDFIVYGVDFTTGACGPASFVDVFDSTGAHSIHNIASQRASFRWYNVNGSTDATGGDTSVCSGFSGPKYPVRFNRGLFFRPSGAGYNGIKLYWWKPEDN